ncbi:hypothetical protein B0I35DRAFT_414647 [Stachybotrys elegans]|uniref:Uncharacterized protein n=1 Tax=Stachybotrys elegans TaxID=80388 RepID=A0A8K0SEZ3_9HYPO|nr:hypothetical protein B0I35DRAFT_414647 [Stachybotrys elegans]
MSISELKDGANHNLKERLRSRKKKSKEYTEYEKWNDMYLIIFPEDDPACIPSPYYDYMTPQNPDLNGFPSAFSQYEQFLRQELPSRVRQELEVRIRERLNPIEEGLRGELVDIVRDMQLQLFNIYRASRATPNTTDNAIVSPENGNAVISGAASGETDQIWDTAEQLQPFSQPPHLDDLQFDAFNGLVFDFSVPDMDFKVFQMSHSALSTQWTEQYSA